MKGNNGYIAYLIDQFERRQAFPIDIYGDVTILSVDEKEEVVEMDDKEKCESGEKKETHKIWKCNPPKGGILRNLQVLGENGKEYKTYDEKVRLQNRLYDLKSGLAHNNRFDDLPFKIRLKFSEKSWYEGGIKIEFRKVGTNDIMPINTIYRRVGMKYKGERILANLVFDVFSYEYGRLCRFDLGGLSHPNKLAKFANSLIGNLNGVDGLPDGMIETIKRDVINYNIWFERHYNKLIEKLKTDPNATEIVELDEDSYEKSYRTWFKPTKNITRLGGNISPNELFKPDKKVDSEKEDNNTFLKRNTAIYCSDVYIYGGGDYDLFDKNLDGRSVIFVSSDRSLLNKRESEVVEVCISNTRERKALFPPPYYTAPISMIALGSYGLSFRQLACDRANLRLYKKIHLGAGMYVALWNARVALLNLKSALDDFCLKNGLDYLRVERLMEADWLDLKNSFGDNKLLNEFFENNNITIEQLQDFRKFNEIDIINNVAMFRLGYCENGRGHIQKFKVDGSVLFDDGVKEANFVTINTHLMNKYLALCEDVLRYLCIRCDRQSVGLGLCEHFLKREGESYVSFARDEYINPPSAKHKLTLSGSICSWRINSDSEIYSEHMRLQKGESWSFIPGVITQYFRTINFLQNNPDTKIKYIKNLYDFIWKIRRKRRVKGYKGDIILYDFASVVGENGILDKTRVVDGEKIIDTALGDMFNFVFHGTIEDIHRKENANNPILRADHAYYKYGFFINPTIKYEGGEPKELYAGVEYFFYENEELRMGEKYPIWKIGFPSVHLYCPKYAPLYDGLFNVNVSVRQSGYRLFIDRQIEFEKNQRERDKKEPQKADKIKPKESERVDRKPRRKAHKKVNENNNDVVAKPEEEISSAEEDLAKEAAGALNGENINNLNNFVGANEGMSQSDNKIQMLTEIAALLQNANEADMERYRGRDEKFDEHLAKFVNSLNNPEELRRMISEEYKDYRHVIGYLEKIGKNNNAAWAENIVDILFDCA